ncbi:hypothetical protein ES708_06654 [subsurface metagenome]
MARISLSEILQNIAGSVGEHTFSCWKGINYLRQKAVTISNPCSFAQSSARAAFSVLARMWHAELTAAQRALWNEYAQGLKSASEQVGPNGNGGSGIYQVIPGSGGVMSGFNSFVQVNMTALLTGFPLASPPVPDAPMGIDAPDAPTGLSSPFYCFLPAQSCRIYLQWTDPVVAPVGSIIRLWVVSLDGGVHKQINALVPLGQEDTSLTQVKAALGALSDVEDLPGHYLFQIDCVSPSGLKSPPSNVLTVDVTPTCDACVP